MRKRRLLGGAFFVFSTSPAGINAGYHAVFMPAPYQMQLLLPLAFKEPDPFTQQDGQDGKINPVNGIPILEALDNLGPATDPNLFSRLAFQPLHIMYRIILHKTNLLSLPFPMVAGKHMGPLLGIYPFPWRKLGHNLVICAVSHNNIVHILEKQLVFVILCDRLFPA